jgi:hypothetical protein
MKSMIIHLYNLNVHPKISRIVIFNQVNLFQALDSIKLFCLDCVDTENWNNIVGFTCFEYEVIQLWCANGKFTPSNNWTGGPQFNYPERNCCACGKGLFIMIFI